jgi:thiamine pyrophosphate-dependent acetolactate synthase large subunit-like protein
MIKSGLAMLKVLESWGVDHIYGIPGGSNAVPLRPEPVFKEISRIADDDAIFITDVGNVTIFAVRMLKMNGKQKFSTSGFFATMGYGGSGGIAAKLSLSEKTSVYIKR